MSHLFSIRDILKAAIASLATLFAVSAGNAGTQQSPPGLSVQVTGTFDYPGTGNLTRPQKISDRGDIVGFFVDTAGASHGFVLTNTGAFSPPLTDPHDSGGLSGGLGMNHPRLAS